MGWSSLLNYRGTVSSTQSEAKELAEAGVPEGTAVLAEEQTAGRGRQGRRWHSPKGAGVWMSVVLRPEMELKDTPQLTLLAGVAVCQTIREHTGVQAAIKWPNDLLVGERKICGILVESALSQGQIRYIIAGIGIDVAAAEEDYPEELRRVATSLRIESGGRIFDRVALAENVLTELQKLYRLYAAEGFAPISRMWSGMSATLGRRVLVGAPETDRVSGIAVALDETGCLVVEDEAGSLHSVHSGEIAWI